MALGKLIDSTEIRNPNEDFGQSAARIGREPTEGWKPQKVGVVEECSTATMTEIDPVHYKAKQRGSVSNVFLFKPSES